MVDREFITNFNLLRYVILVCAIILVTVGALRLIQMCRERSVRQTEIRAFNAGTVL